MGDEKQGGMIGGTGMVTDLEQHQLEKEKDLNPLELDSTKGYESDDLQKNKARLEEVECSHPRTTSKGVKNSIWILTRSAKRNL